jgi:hypothetical protein
VGGGRDGGEGRTGGVGWAAGDGVKLDCGLRDVGRGRAAGVAAREERQGVLGPDRGRGVRVWLGGCGEYVAQEGSVVLVCRGAVECRGGMGG